MYAKIAELPNILLIIFSPALSTQLHCRCWTCGFTLWMSHILSLTSPALPISCPSFCRLYHFPQNRLPEFDSLMLDRAPKSLCESSGEKVTPAGNNNNNNPQTLRKRVLPPKMPQKSVRFQSNRKRSLKI
jgi:hypothetical protein